MTGYLTDSMQENPKAFQSYIKRLQQDNPGVGDFEVDKCVKLFVRLVQNQMYLVDSLPVFSQMKISRIWQPLE